MKGEDINKVKKKGRIKKYRNKSGKHDKYQQDNIIRLFKVHLMNNIYKYINFNKLCQKNNLFSNPNFYLLILFLMLQIHLFHIVFVFK